MTKHQKDQNSSKALIFKDKGQTQMQQMAVIESLKCSCQYTLQHKTWCKETTSTDQPCRCGHCRQHKKDCKYIVTKCLIMKEYLSIPILGYNSGKYDLTFTYMQKYDISPL
ncbi:hypothetical protein PROFUN_15852 [Planoprotostelium fungivorum]|uniref:Uncharacterized protein n=1 Tax=Planoprotostelium fungivorum TaxID=1890364 RepID=A0A2P6MU32_9EUKA|nr:hypothetical protein PROFUN_15852 [Planoprotostelium fungivorum]